MKPLIVLALTLVGTHWAYAGPAVGLQCESADGEFTLEAVINQHSGDIFEESLQITEKGVQKKARLLQYKKYDDDLFMIFSLGPSGFNDDTGYILDLKKSYTGDRSYTGYGQKYHANPPGTREEETDAYLRIVCTLLSP